jgi:hypothetical protein
LELTSKARDLMDEDIEWQEELFEHLEDSRAVPLVAAAKILDDVELMKLLMEHGADPNYTFPGNGAFPCFLYPSGLIFRH